MVCCLGAHERAFHGPYLGNLLGPAGLVADTNQNDFATLTFSLAAYAGKTVYFAYRTSANAASFPDSFYAFGLTSFALSC